MLNLLSNFEKAKSWLLYSGIFNYTETKENCGAVYSYFDEQKNEYSFLYPEITGYFLSILRFFYNMEENKAYLKFGKLSADWLIRIFEKYGEIIQGIHSSKIQKISYSFDTAICAKGFIDYYLLSGDSTYLQFAKRLVKKIDDFMEPDGTVKPYRNLVTNRFEEDSKAWYKQKGCFHIKTAIPYFQLFQITKEPKLSSKGSLICDTYKKFQNSDGSFRLHTHSKVINLHALCYALEGLLYGYKVTKNENYLKSCQQTVNWVTKKIEEDGSVELWYNSKYRSKAAYPVAQLIRIMVLLDKIQKINLKKYEKQLFSFLIPFQAYNSKKEINGGFYEELKKSLFGWKKQLRINSWTSMFAIQAMYWMENYEKLSFEEAIEYLF